MMIMGVLEFFYLVGLFALSWVFYWFVVNIPGGRGVPKNYHAYYTSGCRASPYSIYNTTLLLMHDQYDN